MYVEPPPGNNGNPFGSPALSGKVGFAGSTILVPLVESVKSLACC